MGADDPRDRLRRTLSGYSQEELGAILVSQGYVLDRQARHGEIYRHPELATEHPELAVRRRYAYLLIPKGRELKAVYARNVLEALEVLASWRKEKHP